MCSPRNTRPLCFFLKATDLSLPQAFSKETRLGRSCSCWLCDKCLSNQHSDCGVVPRRRHAGWHRRGCDCRTGQSGRIVPSTWAGVQPGEVRRGVVVRGVLVFVACQAAGLPRCRPRLGDAIGHASRAGCGGCLSCSGGSYAGLVTAETCQH